MADQYNLSAQDKTDLAQIRSRLPQGDPRRDKIDLLIGPQETVSARPPLFSKAGLKSAAYTLGEKAINMLPAIGGTAGGLLAGGVGAETGPGDIALASAGAAAGGAAGEHVRQKLLEHIFPQEKKMTGKEAVTSVLEQGAGQGVSELLGEGMGKLFAPTLERTIQKLYFAGNLGPQRDLELVMPEILIQEKQTPAKTVGGFLNVVGDAKKKIANEVDTAMMHKVRVGVKMQNLGAVDADVTPIASRIDNLATAHPSEVEANPARITAIKNRATKLYSVPRSYAWLNDRRTVLNRELNRFYAMKTPAEQAQYLFQHPEFEIDKAEADAIRDVIYPQMDKAAGKPAGYFENLQRKRGALMSIEDQTIEHAKNLEMRMKQAKGAPPTNPLRAYGSGSGHVGFTTRLTHAIHAPNVSRQADKQVAKAFGRTATSKTAKAAASPVGRQVMVLPLRMLVNPAMPNYAHTAVNDQGHRIGSNDGQQWFDVQTGAPVQ